MRIAVRGDARALKQIVLNLLSNAVKFTPQGGVASLHIEHSDEALALVVTDTGIGIDAAALAIAGPAVPTGGRLDRTQIWWQRPRVGDQS